MGTRVELVFTVVQHSRDEELLKALIRVFGCGKYALRKNNLAGDFIVNKFEDIQLKIIPFFDKYSRIPLWTILVHKGQATNLWIFQVSSEQRQ